jgi:hypothetical protein
MPTDSELPRKLAMGLTALAALLLVGAGTLDYGWAKSTLERETREVLDRDWGAMKGYLRLEFDPATRVVQDRWYYDADDADEVTIVSRIRDRCLIMDQTGRLLHEPGIFQEIGSEMSARINRGGSLDSPLNSPFWTTRHGRAWYMVRVGVVSDESRSSQYSVALVKPLALNGDALLPFELYSSGLILGALMLGWSVGRRTPRSIP